MSARVDNLSDSSDLVAELREQVQAALGFTRRVRGAVEALHREAEPSAVISQRVRIAIDLLRGVVFDRDGADSIEMERDCLRELLSEATAERDALQLRIDNATSDAAVSRAEHAFHNGGHATASDRMRAAIAAALEGQ